MGHSAGHDIDPTFYRSPAEAIAAPPEQLAYVVAFDRAGAAARRAHRASTSTRRRTGYGQVVGWADLPTLGDELHHFGWNACSSALKHEGHDTDGLQRRYLLLPGLRQLATSTSTTPSPTRASPRCTRRSSATELAAKAGYSRPHTLHCGPDGIFLSCLGGGERRRRPGRHRAARPRHVRRAAGLGDRPRAAVPGLRRLVAPEPEHADHQRVGHPVDDRGRGRARAAARPEVRPRAALLGPGRGPAPADGRPRRAAPDGAGAAPVARPGGHLGLRRRRGLHRGPVRVGLALAPRRRRAGRWTR